MIKCVGRVVVGPNEAVLGALYAGTYFFEQKTWWQKNSGQNALY